MDYKKYVRNVLNDYNDNIKWDVKEKYEVKFDEYFSFYDVFEDYKDDVIILKIRYLVELNSNDEEFDRIKNMVDFYIGDIIMRVWFCRSLMNGYEEFKDKCDWELFDRWCKDDVKEFEVVLEDEREREFWFFLRDIKEEEYNKIVLGNICNKELYSFLMNRGIWCDYNDVSNKSKEKWEKKYVEDVKGEKKIVFDKFKSNKFYYNGRDKENEE